MSADYTTCLCYGMVIPYEIVEKIDEQLDDDKICDTFHDLFLHVLDGWDDGGDYFLGFICPLGEQCIEIPFSEIIDKEVYTLEEFLEFHELFDIFQLNDFIEWKPRKSIITFCW